MKSVFSSADKATCELALLNDGGEKIWVQLEGLRIAETETCRVTAINITKRKLAEAEREKLAAIVASSDDAIVGKTLDGIITSWNTGAQKLYGYTGQEAIGQSLSILVPKDRPDELPGILSQIRRGESVEHYETLRVRKDGTQLDVSITVSPIFDELGRVVAASSISRDISARKRAEDELKERESRLRIANFDLERAQSVAHVGIWKWDLKTRTVEWSDEMYRIFGIDKNSYTGRLGDAISKLIHPDDLHVVLPSNASEFASNKPQEYRIIRATDGSIRNIWAKSGDAIMDAQGNPVYLTGVAQDVTERKQAEEKLHESEARYRAISESANDAIISVDEASNIVNWNPGAERMFGYTEAEAHGQPLNLILPERYIGDHQAAMERVQSGGEKHIIGKTIEREGRRKDNTEFSIEISVSEWHVGDKKYYSAIIRDITARKDAEKKLAATQAMYQLLAENSWDSVSLINAEGKIEYASPSYTRRLGYAENEMLDLDTQGILERLHPDDRNYVDMEVKRGRALKLPSTRYEYRARTKSGEYIWFEDVVHREFDEHGQFVRSIINSRDISERKQADAMIAQYANELEVRVEERTAELVLASHAKDDFLANMSHELRTPLNSILGFSETLLEGVRGPLNDRQKEALEYVNSSGHHLLGLINDILDLSKVEANKLDIHPEVVAINEVCMSSLVFIRQIALKKSIKIEYIRQPEAETIIADPKRLKQILVNLLSNAAKFTPEMGHIKLEVKTDAAEEIMQFSVSDTGIGISEENLQILFKPFVQVDSSLSRHYDGTGLGLVLVKRLAEMHGGNVRAESEEGLGSCFTVTLPWKMEWKDNAENPASEVDLPKPTVAEIRKSVGVRILLAEDNEISVIVVRDYLEHYGYEVFVASDGEQVLPLAEQCNPDLILMDVQMPKLSGVDATLRVRSESKFDSVPILALTALAMPGDHERLLEAGVDDYLSKPVNLQSLTKMIEKHLPRTS